MAVEMRCVLSTQAASREDCLDDQGLQWPSSAGTQCLSQLLVACSCSWRCFRACAEMRHRQWPSLHTLRSLRPLALKLVPRQLWHCQVQFGSVTMESSKMHVIWGILMHSMLVHQTGPKPQPGPPLGLRVPPSLVVSVSGSMTVSFVSLTCRFSNANFEMP